MLPGILGIGIVAVKLKDTVTDAGGDLAPEVDGLANCRGVFAGFGRIGNGRGRLFNLWRRRRFLDDVSRMIRSEALKERAKHHVLAWLALVRDTLGAIDRRFRLQGAVFELKLEEIQESQEGLEFPSQAGRGISLS